VVPVATKRRKRIDRRGVERTVHLLENLDIQVDRADLSMARIIALAENHGLTAYDATYLELAAREGIRLASSDGDLIAAAKAAKIALM
jgi:predicted nucleic acid-binding protein